MRLLLNRKNDMQGIKNLTHGPINRQLFNLAMPIMATSFIQMAYLSLIHISEPTPYRHGMGRTIGQ